MFSFWVFLFNSSWSCLFPLVGKPSRAKSELDSPCGVSVASQRFFSLLPSTSIILQEVPQYNVFSRWAFSFFLLLLHETKNISPAFFFVSGPQSEEERESFMWHTYLEFLAKAVEGELVCRVSCLSCATFVRRLCDVCHA